MYVAQQLRNATTLNRDSTNRPALGPLALPAALHCQWAHARARRIRRDNAIQYKSLLFPTLPTPPR